MNVATFSPDQLYLALARNDNQTHVYDRRMLGKQGSEPLFKYCHYGESKTVSKHEVYGVVQAQWLQSSATRRTCLVTGGEDGEHAFALAVDSLNRFSYTRMDRMCTHVGPLSCCPQS
jgi:hypothetical protein